jgi:hypothetical protein
MLSFHRAPLHPGAEKSKLQDLMQELSIKHAAELQRNTNTNPKVGRCRSTLSRSELKLRLVSALETKMW